MTDAQPPPGVRFPRVVIQFCTQCKWMLRAAYFAQELLSTFPTSLGEVSLQPSTGGTFTVTARAAPSSPPQTLWDRKRDGGFPETKELKRRARDVVEPGRDLGHVDRGAAGRSAGRSDGCEDCATGQEGEGKGEGEEGGDG